MTLRTGMVGPGRMGLTHIERIHSVISGGRVTAVSDINPAQAERVASDFDQFSWALKPTWTSLRARRKKFWWCCSSWPGLSHTSSTRSTRALKP